MANEKRLIDANALIEHLKNCIGTSNGLISATCVAIKCYVEQMPTVDAVEVVYCDNCVAHGSCVFEPILHCLGYKKPFCCAGKMDGDGNG